jgi:hypothetical protein
MPTMFLKLSGPQMRWMVDPIMYLIDNGEQSQFWEERSNGIFGTDDDFGYLAGIIERHIEWAEEDGDRRSAAMGKRLLTKVEAASNALWQKMQTMQKAKRDAKKAPGWVTHVHYPNLPFVVVAGSEDDDRLPKGFQVPRGWKNAWYYHNNGLLYGPFKTEYEAEGHWD